MEEAAVHLMQRLLSSRENKGFGSGTCRAEDFRRRVSVVRRSAASDLVHESPQALILPFPLHQVFGPFRSSSPSDLVQRLPQNLVLSFPLHQVFEFQFSVYDVTWCFAPRKPLFLRPQTPRLSDPMGFRRPGRGASSPASPYSFVEGHHVPRSGWAAALTDVVLHSPKSLIPSSGGTTSLSPDGPPPSLAWCFTSRNPLFLRRGASRPRPRMGLEKEVRTNLPFDCTSIHFCSV